MDGRYIEKFEAQFAQHYSMKYALATNSCRMAFYLIIRALNIKEGDEVILPAFNISAFPKILKLNRIIPVFVDIDSKTLNIDVRQIEKNITGRTKAIVAVHLFGNPCDMDSIMETARKYNLAVIEDCANAIGAKYKGKLTGTFGDAACFSFSYTKDIHTFGGGIVLTDDEDIYRNVKEMYDSEFAFPSKYEVLKIIAKNFLVMLATWRVIFFVFTYPLILFTRFINSDILGDIFEEKDKMIRWLKKTRFMNFQAYVGLKRLNKLTELQNKRIVNARIYNQLLANENCIRLPESLLGSNHIYWRYPVWVGNRDRIIKELIKHGVDCGKIYTYNCSDYRIFKEYKTNCPISEEASNKIIVLPVDHYLKENEVRFISKLLLEIFIKNTHHTYNTFKAER